MVLQHRCWLASSSLGTSREFASAARLLQAGLRQCARCLALRPEWRLRRWCLRPPTAPSAFVLHAVRMLHSKAPSVITILCNELLAVADVCRSLCERSRRGCSSSQPRHRRPNLPSPVQSTAHHSRTKRANGARLALLISCNHCEPFHWKCAFWPEIDPSGAAGGSERTRGHEPRRPLVGW